LEDSQARAGTFSIQDADAQCQEIMTPESFQCKGGRFALIGAPQRPSWTSLVQYDPNDPVVTSHGLVIANTWKDFVMGLIQHPHYNLVLSTNMDEIIGFGQASTVKVNIILAMMWHVWDGPAQIPFT
jgi:hypothetical protein